jgi:hypothetical protein
MVEISTKRYISFWSLVFLFEKFKKNLCRCACIGVVMGVFLLGGNQALGQVIIGQDHATAYGGSWANGSNEGFGFGPWTFSSGGSAGAFIGNPATAGITGMDVESFGLWANPEGGNFVNADRPFTQPLPVGATFSFQWGVNWDSDGSGNKGFNLYSGGTGGTELISVNMGGSALITINGNPMFTEYGTQAMTLHFEMVTATELRVHGTGRDGSEAYDETFPVAGPPDAIRFYANNLASGDERQPYFNDLRIAFPATAQLEGNLLVDRIIIQEDSSLDLQNNTLTLLPGGFFENNGLLVPDNGMVEFRAGSSVSGNSQTVFLHAVVDGTDVSFGPYTDGVPQSVILGILEIRSGNVVEGGAPELAQGSTLYYRTGGIYQRVVEWNNPWHVQIGFETNLNLNLNDWGSDITVRGNLIIDENSTLTVDEGAGAFDLVVEGDLVLNGTLELSGSFGRDMQVKGDWYHSGSFNPNAREVSFNGDGLQTIHNHTAFDYLRINNPGGEVLLGTDIVVNNRLEVDPGAMLNMQDLVISGGGIFELKEDGGLKIGHPQGISQAGASGNIQTTEVRTFAPAATYHFIGKEDQQSGNALPVDSARKNIIVELGDDAFTLSINTSSMVNIDAPGRLEIISGTLRETESTASRGIEGAGNLVMSGGRYLITSIAETVAKPRLSGTYSITGGVIELGAAGLQMLRGGKPYYNLTFSGSGVVTASTTTDISGTVSILDDKILDLGSSSFGNATTNLTMEGNSRLISTATGTFPAMGGTYNLNGGTIVFGNTSATNQSIRSPREYFNIEVTGTSVQNGGGNITVKSGGTFSIKENGRFQISSTMSVVGDGHFQLEPGGTLRYAHALGITLEACGTGTSCGNIRTRTRTFSPEAKYELYGSTTTQYTGSGMPAAVAGLLIDKGSTSSQVILTNPVDVAGIQAGALTLNRGRLLTDGNALRVINTQPGAVAFGPANNADYTGSYVVGALTRRLIQSPQPYAFPVGTPEYVEIARLTFHELDDLDVPYLTVSFSADNPSAEEIDISELGLEIDGTLLTQRLDYGFWTFETHGFPSEFLADVSLTSRGHQNGGSVPESHAVIRREHGAADWEIPFPGLHDNATQSGSGIGPITAVVSNINSFSDYVIAFSDLGPLPVELLSFEGMMKPEGVLLQWSTATEINNDFFTVERSPDGLQYVPLTNIPGAGFSNQITHYDFLDAAPVDGLVYYRLRQTDYDGTYEYVGNIALLWDGGAISGLRVEGPFYAGGDVWFAVNHPGNEVIRLEIFNVSGNPVHNQRISSGRFQMPASVPRGIYLARFSTRNEVQTIRFLIQ